MPLRAARAVLGGILEILLPRTCLVCGRPLWGGAGGPPLCPECAALLIPQTGERCERCGKPLISEDRICMRCRGREWSFDSAYPLFSYLGRAEALISAYKFGGRLSLAPCFCGLFAAVLNERWPGWPLVPVPPRPGKIRRKGWDQVELIARGLERRGFQVLRVLERRPSLEQKKLGLEARFENAACAYALKEKKQPPLSGLSLVLIDDVFTTGATAEACARALKAAGAAHVCFVSIAAD